MCEYCEVDDCGVGENLTLDKCLLPKNDAVEVYLFNSPDDEHFVLMIDGSFTEIKMKVNFCPVCGREIGHRAG